MVQKGHVSEAKFDNEDIRAMEKAVELVQLWNGKQYMEQRICVNVHEVWTFPKSDFLQKDTKVLVEPYIENYRKFNSSTGWNDSTTLWPQVMQALSHFTYRKSKGKYLLCDIQGGVDSKAAVLTDPALLSNKKEFGVTDLGPHGITTFFTKHRCNHFCWSHWRKNI